MSTPAIILLAAGESARLGRSKQLLTLRGISLLRHTALAAIGSGIENVLVVLGANSPAHQQEIDDLNVTAIVNADWQKGMGNSLKYGLFTVQQHWPSTSHVIILVCDQPHINSAHIIALERVFARNKIGIVASAYAGIIGVPVLFDRNWFIALSKLQDDQGAKGVIDQNQKYVITVPFPEGAIDIDTEADVTEFLKD
jgi:molybdenum cofactor cytidylyltransferase